MSGERINLNIPGLKSDHDFIAVAEGLGLGPFKGSGKEKHGPCPLCFKSDKYSINPAKGVSNCFSCGFHPDILGLIQHMKNCGFMDAVKYLGGDVELSEEDRRAQEKRRKDRERQADKDEAAKRIRDAKTIKNICAGLEPLAGSAGQDYLRGRGCDPCAVLAPSDDLKFHPKLEAFYGATGARKSAGFFPAVVMLGRDSKDNVTILHRTYLEKKGGEICKADPRDKKGNLLPKWNAKQVVGRIPADFVGVDLGSHKNIHYVCALSVNPLRGRYRREEPAKSSGWRPSSSQTQSGNFIAVGEGLETVISVAVAMEKLAPVMIPNLGYGKSPGILVLADNDFKDTIQGSGAQRAIQAFQTVERRLTGMGHAVRTVWPPLGMDFNDFLLTQDAEQEKVA